MAMLLAVMMCFSLLPVSAFAEEGDQLDDSTLQTTDVVTEEQPEDEEFVEEGENYEEPSEETVEEPEENQSADEETEEIQPTDDETEDQEAADKTDSEEENTDEEITFDIGPEPTEPELPEGALPVPEEYLEELESIPGVTLASHNPYGPDTDGYCGENATWSYDSEEKTLTISGEGEMHNYYWGTTPWVRFSGVTEHVVVEDGITAIGQYAFANFYSLQDVTLGASVNAIYYGAFMNDSALESVSGGSLSIIGGSAFSYCYALQSIELQSGSKLYNYAFYYCQSLQSLGSSCSLAQVYLWSLGFCVSLGEVKLADGVYIAPYAFYHIGATEITIPDNAEGNLWGAFALSDIEQFSVDTVTGSIRYATDGDALYVYDYAAQSYDLVAASATLETYTVWENCGEIGGMSFDGCWRLKSVIIPAGVSKIDEGAFGGCCYNLTDICFLQGKNDPLTIDKLAFYQAYDTPYTYIRVPDVANINAAIKKYAWNEGGRRGYAIVSDGADIISFTGSYLLVKTGETAVNEIAVAADIENLSDAISVSVVGEDRESVTDIITVNSGETEGSYQITANEAGTAYIIAEITLGNRTYSSECRVDVADETVTDSAFKATLLTPTAAVELYKTDYTQINVLLEIEQNITSIGSTLNSDENGTTIENKGNTIAEAKFSDETVDKLFKLQVVDDRTLEIVPDLENNEASAFKAAKYSSTIEIAARDAAGNSKTLTTSALTFTLKKSKPTIKANKIGTFNLFYSGLSYGADLTFTGGNVTALTPDTSKANPIPDWVAITSGESYRYDGQQDSLGFRVYNVSTLTGSKSGTMYLLATVDGWAGTWPVSVAVSGKYTAPSLKLKTSAVTVQNPYEDSKTIYVYIASGNKNSSLSSYGISEVTTAENSAIEVLSSGQSGSDSYKVAIKPTVNLEKAANATLEVHFSGTDRTVNLTLKLNPQKKFALKAKNATVTVNPAVQYQARVELAPTTVTNYDFGLFYGDDTVISITNTKTKEDATDCFVIIQNWYMPEKVSEGREGGYIAVIPKKGQVEYGATYKVTISNPKLSAPATFNIATVKNIASPSLTIKKTAGGTLDLSKVNSSSLSVQLVYANCQVGNDIWANTDLKIMRSTGGGEPVDVTNKTMSLETSFTGTAILATVRLFTDVEDDIDLKTDKFTLVAETSIEGLDQTVKAEYVIPLKRSNSVFKFSTSTVTLNGNFSDDCATITATPSLKGYSAGPGYYSWVISYRYTSHIDNPLDIQFEENDDGGCNIKISQTDNTVAGITYTVTVWQRDKFTSSSSFKVNVTNKWPSVASISVSSKNIDPLISDSAVKFKVKLNNLSSIKNPFVAIYDSDGNRVDGYDGNDVYFNFGGQNLDFVITPVSNDVPEGKYTCWFCLDLDGDGMSDISKSFTFTVKRSSVTAKASSTNLKLLKNDRFSTAEFTLTPSNTRVDGIAKVEVASKLLSDKKNDARDVFEVYKLGSGQYALGFKNNDLTASIKSEKVTLNVFFKGNLTAKPDTTVTLTVAIA